MLYEVITLSEDQEQVRKEVLVQSALDAVVLQGQPANPRLRLLNAGGSETLWQQIEAGLHPEAVSLDFQGEAFAELLAPALRITSYNVCYTKLLREGGQR